MHCQHFKVPTFTQKDCNQIKHLQKVLSTSAATATTTTATIAAITSVATIITITFNLETKRKISSLCLS